MNSPQARSACLPVALSPVALSPRAVSLAALTFALLSAPAHAQDCFSVQPAPFAGWLGAARTTSTTTPADIRDALVHDFDGPGPLPERLFVTGAFTHIGGIFANGIAAFDGDRWIPLESGLSISVDSSANAGGSALVVQDNEIVIGGTFPALGGNQFFDKRVSGITRWNGMTLEPSYQSNDTSGPSPIGGNSVFSLASAHGVIYFAGPSAIITNVPGIGSILYGGILTRNGFGRLPVAHSEIAGILSLGNEVMYRGGSGIVAWNGRDARMFPFPASLDSTRFFPYCGIPEGQGFIFGGDFFGELSPGILSIGTVRWSQSWLDLPGMPSPSLPSGPPRVTNVDSFSRRDNSIFAFTWPGFSQRSPMQRLVNNQWVDEPILYSGFTPSNNHIRGEITFQNRRFLYGKINTIPTSSSTRITLPDPANLIAEVDATNRVVPMNGLYNTHIPSLGTLISSVVTGNQLILGGPIGFAWNGTRTLYIAGWDGTHWARIAHNDLADAPIDLALHNGDLYALGELVEHPQNWQLLRRDASNNWVAATPQTFVGRARLHSHDGSLYLFTEASTGPNAYRLVNNTLTPLAEVLQPSSGFTFSVISVGSDLYFTRGGAIRRLTGTTWQTIPTTFSPASNAIVAAYNGALHVIDYTSIASVLTLRVHRLDGTTWTLVSSLAQSTNAPANALEHLGDLFILTDGNLLRYSPVTGWTTYPIGNSSSGFQQSRLLPAPNGSLYLTGPFTSINNDPSRHVAIFAPTAITVNWPPLPRHGVRGSFISIGVGATGRFSSDSGLTYQWQRNDQPLVNGVTTNGTTIIGATSRRLVLRNAQPADAGLYSVRIALACGTNFTTSQVPITISTCNSIDFNNNGIFPEVQDVIDFFDTLAGAPCAGCDSIDFNNNQVFPEEQDVVDFLQVLSGGSCG